MGQLEADATRPAIHAGPDVRSVLLLLGRGGWRRGGLHVATGRLGGATAAGAGLRVSGGASSVQPATKTIASARLASIDEALIPNLTVTGALLECCVTSQIVPILLSQLAHASGP